MDELWHTTSMLYQLYVKLHIIALRRFSLGATCASAGAAAQRTGLATQTKPADPGSFYASLKRIGISTVWR